MGEEVNEQKIIQSNVTGTKSETAGMFLLDMQVKKLSNIVNMRKNFLRDL